MRWLIFLVVLLGLPGPTEPLFTVHASTRSVTCLGAAGVGTTGGLRTPTGLEFPGVPVRALAGDYVATDRGLFRAGRQVWSEGTCAVLETPRGLATGHAGGVLRWGERKFVLATQSPVHSLAWDGQRLWAGTMEGLWAVDEVPVRVPLPNDTVTCLLDGVAGTAGGVFLWKGGDWVRLGPSQPVSALARDGSDILVGTPDRGVFRSEGDTLVAVPGQPLHVSALGAGLVVGTPDAGAWRAGAPLYSTAGEIPGNGVMAVACTADQVCAATFDQGVGMLKTDHWESQWTDSWVDQVAASDGDFLGRLSDGTVINLASGKALGQGWPKTWTSSLGADWVGTSNAFYLRQGARWRVYAPKPALQGVVVTCVARHAGRLWVGSQSGLFEVDPGTGTARRRPGLPDSWITALAEYRGQLYVGTFSGGLTRLDGTPVRSERIHCLLATRHGLWAGTGQGLLRIDRPGHYLDGQTVWCLAERGDKLWIGTDGGLLEASQSRL